MDECDLCTRAPPGRCRRGQFLLLSDISRRLLQLFNDLGLAYQVCEITDRALWASSSSSSIGEALEHNGRPPRDARFHLAFVAPNVGARPPTFPSRRMVFNFQQASIWRVSTLQLGIGTVVWALSWSVAIENA